MKKTVYLAALGITFLLPFSHSSYANDVFDKNCKSCHAGGKNIMNPDKTLSMESLKKNGVSDLAAIKKLVSAGKPPMPPFGKTLKAEQIDEVSAYVLDQAKKGW